MFIYALSLNSKIVNRLEQPQISPKFTYYTYTHIQNKYSYISIPITQQFISAIHIFCICT